MRLDLAAGVASCPVLQAGRGGVSYDFYVDHSNGDDANDGLTEETALQTLAALPALSAGASLGLARGSHWRETLDLTLVPNARIGATGSGANPIIDGADIVAVWTLAGTNVYSASVAHDANSTNRLTVYEDGLLLTRVADVATCEATPGSFVDIKGSDGTPITVQIHTTNSDDPNSNGSTYEVTTRETALQLSSGSVVDGIQTQRAIANNGSFDGVAQPDITASRIFAPWGTKHHGGLGSGVLRDSITYAADPPTSYEPSNGAIVFFMPTIPPDTDYLYERVGFIQPDEFGFGWADTTAHSSDATLYRQGIKRQCWGEGWLNFRHPNGVYDWRDAISEGCFANKALSFSLDFGTVRECLALDRNTDGAVKGLTNLDQRDCAFYGESRRTQMNYNPLFRFDSSSDEITVHNNAFAGDFDGEGSTDMFDCLTNVTATADADFQYNVFFEAGTIIHVRDPLTYTGDYNVFHHRNKYNASENFSCRHNGTFITTLASWQTLTGQDANSVVLDNNDQVPGNANAFWLAWANASVGTDKATIGPAVGDYRINPNARVLDASGTAYIGTYADGITPLTDAGPQSHWDWNLRRSVSGPPTQRPVAPSTYAECLAYVQEPAAWDFYP